MQTLCSVSYFAFRILHLIDTCLFLALQRIITNVHYTCTRVLKYKSVELWKEEIVPRFSPEVWTW